ncbi:MAG: hypothetical protein ACRDDA_00750, partial [Aeromonas sp.]
SQLSQHLRVTHAVKNVAERKLLLALQSGRISVREGRCPVPACEKETSRLDRHLKSHSELSATARRAAVAKLKRDKIMAALSALRASNPVVPLSSVLDLQAETEEPTEAQSAEPEDCDKTACRHAREQVADLNRQVDMLAGSLRDITRRFRAMKRRWRSRPSAQVERVTRTLLSSLDESLQEEDVVPPTPPTSGGATSSLSKFAVGSQQLDQQSPAHFPDHVAALSENEPHEHQVLCFMSLC